MLNVRPVILQTSRLTVTPWESGDLPGFQALHADPITMQFFLSGPYDLEAARTRLGDFVQEQTERGWTKWRVADSNGRTP